MNTALRHLVFFLAILCVNFILLAFLILFLPDPYSYRLLDYSGILRVIQRRDWSIIGPGPYGSEEIRAIDEVRGEVDYKLIGMSPDRYTINEFKQAIKSGVDAAQAKTTKVSVFLQEDNDTLRLFIVGNYFTACIEYAPPDYIYRNVVDPKIDVYDYSYQVPSDDKSDSGG